MDHRTPTFLKQPQPVSGTLELEARKTFKTHFVLLSATLQAPRRLWAAKLLLLLRTVTSCSASVDRIISVQYMGCTNWLYSINGTVVSFCIASSTDDEHDHTQNLQTGNRKRSFPAVGEWLGVDPFSTSQGSCSVARSNHRIQPFIEAPHWPQRMFYVN